MRLRLPRPASPRRGLTLVEMLVSLALLIMLMTVIVQVFQAATGAVSSARAYQEMDDKLRRLDATLRTDLQGVTARFTPPLNPKYNLGYFEYGENSFADVQGEDTDDYIRFTAKAPEGQFFTGRVFVRPMPPQNTNLGVQPITVKSQVAEIIYFLRSGNLYRRVLLVAPERQSSVLNTLSALTSTAFTNLALPVSWQGMNDLSARPSPTYNSSGPATQTMVLLNSLGDLTNRENRFAYSRFANDFDSLNPATGALTGSPEGAPDDFNGTTYIGDGIPDYYPTLYASVFINTNRLIFELDNRALLPTPGRTAGLSFDTMAFPYVYPGAYSRPDPSAFSIPPAGWIHTPDPGNAQTTISTVPNTANSINSINHSPLDLGDNLPPPSLPQTWWGFPTWRETMSPYWTDPLKIVSVAYPSPPNPFAQPIGQPFGLHPLMANVLPSKVTGAAASQWLPPMTSPWRLNPQPYNDGFPSGTQSTFVPLPPATGPWTWNYIWEDDLIMTGVRSFDVKAYDDAYAGFADLGWGDDMRAYALLGGAQTSPPFLTANPVYSPVAGTGFFWPPGTTAPRDILTTMAHEGRMPPLTTDNRLDAQFPGFLLPGWAYSNNVGDDFPAIVRLRRVWDSWSTDYTTAPANGVDPTTRLPIGPPFTPPVYPSYPPPYPAPLRGIQVQIRVVDSRSERVKILTIRQDFSDKIANTP